MEFLTLKKKKKKPPPLLEDLQEGLDCVICLDIPRQDPVYQCDNGHIICRCCRYKSLICPMCNVKLGNARCVAVEKILSKCPISCPNHRYGCTKRMAKAIVEDHQKECKYKPVGCPVTTCHDLLSMEDVIKHMDNMHRGYKIIARFTGAVSHSFDVNHKNVTLQVEGEDPTAWVPSYCTIDGLDFFIMCWRTMAPAHQGRWLAWIYVNATVEVSKKYKFKSSITNSEEDEKMSYSGPVSSLHILRGQILNSGKCLKFDDETAIRYSKDDELKVYFQVYRSSLL